MPRDEIRPNAPETISLPALRRPLGQILIASGVLSEDQLRIALYEQQRQDQPIGRLLVALGFIPESVLRQALSENLGEQCIDLAHAVVDPEAIKLLPRELAKRHRILPLAYDKAARHLLLAAADIHDLIALDRIRARLGEQTRIEMRLAGEQEIEQAIDRHYGHELSIEGILHELETGETEPGNHHTPADGHHHPIARLIDAILADAVKQGASDIHFEPEAGFLRIRYRIDGLLRQIRALHKSCWLAMSVRLKVIAGMNIAETRAPQDGRIALSISGHSVDFRASCQPTLHGENIVLRILDRQKGIVALDELGLTERQSKELGQMMARPEGIILLTGPTGSGKTTTLYSLLNHINREGIHIMTLEDPVEYPMPLIRQTSVAENAKLDFANGIRSMLRQDPDVILIGEIRDAETAEMAFRAAMTGHQVYATLHTNSAVGAIPRLLDSGIPPDIMAGNIIGIIAQRLLRRLCPHCRVPDWPDAAERVLLGENSGQEQLRLFRAKGCEHCGFQGYRGRLAIMELLPIDGALDDLLAARAGQHAIRRHARERGFATLAEDGLRRIREGSTSFDELRRVVNLGQY